MKKQFQSYDVSNFKIKDKNDTETDKDFFIFVKDTDNPKDSVLDTNVHENLEYIYAEATPTEFYGDL